MHIINGRVTFECPIEDLMNTLSPHTQLPDKSPIVALHMTNPKLHPHQQRQSRGRSLYIRELKLFESKQTQG